MTTKNKFKKDRSIFIICGIYGIISLLFFVTVGGKAVLQPDSFRYIETAKHLVSDFFFSYDGISPDYLRTPGYPALLAFFYFFGGGNVTVVLFQIILATSRIYLFYRALIILDTPQKIALWGAALLLLDVQSYAYSFVIMTEPLFSFFLMVALYFLVLFIYGKNKTINFIIFSIALNYALLIRPILVYFNEILIAALFLFCVFKKIGFKYVLIFAGSFFIVWGGWSLRNYHHSSVFIFSTIHNSNMQQYYAPIITATAKGYSGDRGGFIAGATDYHQENFLQQYPEANNGNLNSAEKSLLQKEYGLNFIKKNIGQYIQCNITGLLKEMLYPFQTALLFKESKISEKTFIFSLIQAGYALYLYAIYMLFIIGLVKRRNTVKFIHAGVLLLCAYLAVAGAIFATIRFRYPFFALIVFGAVNNIEVIINYLSEKVKNPFIRRICDSLLER